MVQSPESNTLDESGFWPHPSRDEFYLKETPCKKKRNLHGFNLKKNCFINQGNTSDFNFCSKVYDVGEEEFFFPINQNIPLQNKFNVLDNMEGDIEDTQPIQQGYYRRSPKCVNNIKCTYCSKYNYCNFCNNNCNPDFDINCNGYKNEEMRENKYFCLGYPSRFTAKPNLM